MKNIGIVTEYNPFHNGHLYQIQQIRELLKPDLITVVMSQDIMQRGSFASFDKWWRTEKALESGVDLVIGLPFHISAQSAETFAQGAVSMLNTLGVTHLAFGAETDNLSFLNKIAQFLTQNEEVVYDKIKHFMKQGLNFPVSREKALASFGFEASPLSQPNNILAIEYLKTINTYNFSINPFLIPRVKAGYHDNAIDSFIASASAIRTNLNSNQHNLSHTVPYPVNELITNFKTVEENSLFASFIVKLLHSSLEALNNIVGINEDRAHQFLNLLGQVNTLDDIFIRLKSKNITQTAINRMILNFLLDYRKQTQQELLAFNSNPYLHILGFNKNGQSYLKSVNAHKITNLGKSKSKLNEVQMKALDLDLKAANLRSLFLQLKEYNKDYFTKPIILNL